MRALCGAIITAGALIGLGLWTIGVGQRYSLYHYRDAETLEVQWVLLRHLDTGLLVALTALLGTLVIGLGIAFLGLAYHHHRRHLEMQHLHRQATSPPGPLGPPDRPPSERVTL
jgi:hypothetical protein